MNKCMNVSRKISHHRNICNGREFYISGVGRNCDTVVTSCMALVFPSGVCYFPYALGPRPIKHRSGVFKSYSLRGIFFRVSLQLADLMESDTRWFEYDRDKMWLVYTQSVPVIFEPPFHFIIWLSVIRQIKGSYLKIGHNYSLILRCTLFMYLMYVS